MSIDRKAAIDMATQAGFKYVDHIAFRGSYNKCTTNEKYEIDCLVRLCNLSAQDTAAERDAWKQAHDEQVEKLIEIADERDALKDAARLALDALNTCETEGEQVRYSTYDTESVGSAIAALKAVL